MAICSSAAARALRFRSAPIATPSAPDDLDIHHSDEAKDGARGWLQVVECGGWRVGAVNAAVSRRNEDALAGGLSILLGYLAKIGTWLIVLFLVPVTLMMHIFWTVSDPMAAQVQMIMFMKNVSMLGAALLISQFGAGPFSLDRRRSRG